MSHRFLPASLLLVGVLANTVQSQQPEQLKALRWRSLGPANTAGRISVVVGVPGNRDVYYVAGANGGIIKTSNGGIPVRLVVGTIEG